MCEECSENSACSCSCTFEEKVDWFRSFMWRWILTGDHCAKCDHWRRKH